MRENDNLKTSYVFNMLLLRQPDSKKLYKSHLNDSMYIYMQHWYKN